MNLKMDKTAFINYLEKKGMTLSEIPDTCWGILFFYTTVIKWAAELKVDKDWTEDDPLLGHLKTSTTNVEVDTFHCIVLHNRRFTLHQVIHLTFFCFRNSNPTCVVTILEIMIKSHVVRRCFWKVVFLTEILRISKLSSRLVPRMLMPDYKLNWVDISKTLLISFQANLKNFYCRLITRWNNGKTLVPHPQRNSSR